VHIQSVQIADFRNLEGQQVELSAGVNLLVGDNGQGKTNFLEAIHLLASLRSFRPSTIRQMIRHQAERAEVQARIDADGVPLSLRLVIEPAGRRLWIGQRSITAVGEYLGQLGVVAFTPDDLAMIKGAPALRRRFLDRAAFLFQPSHLPAVRSLAVALRARNRLLAQASTPDRLQIDSFSKALAEWGCSVSLQRRSLVERIAPAAARILEQISGGQLCAELRFQPGWKMSATPRAQELQGQLRQQLESDLRRKTTSLGPQRDDFEMLLAGQPARRFASQGQQRACAVALLLAVVECSVSAQTLRPVLLLDDVSSELDAKVRSRLFERVRSLGGQVLVTTTEPGLGDEIGAERVFAVGQGRIVRVGGQGA
jgi:DNA replication and repair protein RecF